MPFRIAAVLTLVMFASLLGCQSFDSMKPRAHDYRDWTEEEDDQWSWVGKEARGDRPIEKENDPFKRFLMSDRARNIERNLGYE